MNCKQGEFSRVNFFALRNLKRGLLILKFAQTQICNRYLFNLTQSLKHILNIINTPADNEGEGGIKLVQMFSCINYIIAMITL